MHNRLIKEELYKVKLTYVQCAKRRVSKPQY